MAAQTSNYQTSVLLIVLWMTLLPFEVPGALLFLSSKCHTSLNCPMCPWVLYFYGILVHIKLNLLFSSQAVLHAKSLQLGLTLCHHMDYSPPASSVHRILQARILEWVATSSSRGSFQPRNWTLLSYVFPVLQLQPKIWPGWWSRKTLNSPPSIGTPK